MDSVEVAARFDEKGKIIPFSFIYNQHTYRVESISHRWKSDDGHHILVMTPGNRADHLLFAQQFPF
ncbi:MAG: hypothetical protein U9Q82_05375 [Chloroflexota bacterium]|nr:hypothetical protein [Chloroflexota bacterium]